MKELSFQEVLDVTGGQNPAGGAAVAGLGGFASGAGLGMKIGGVVGGPFGAVTGGLIGGMIGTVGGVYSYFAMK